MTLYLLVVGLCWYGCVLDNHTPCETAVNGQNQPRVDFFLSWANAAKEYAAQPNGSARLFKIGFTSETPEGTHCYRHFEAPCLSVKQLNVTPAQSYEESDKANMEIRP